MPQLNQDEVFQVVYGLIGGLLGLLLFGNIFFIKKLVHKIDRVDPLSLTIESLGNKVDELCSKVETLFNLRIEVATLKERLHRMHVKHGTGGNGELVDEDVEVDRS